MSKDKTKKQEGMSRRGFLAAGGIAAAGLAAGCAGKDAKVALGEALNPAPDGPPKISRYRTLGRTGFKVSDLSMGCGSIAEPNVVRYAYDHGVNLFDTAEVYGNGDSETKIGGAMEHMDREKIFIVTKLGIDDSPDEQNLIERFNKCLERLKTPYADALYSHGIADEKLVTYEPFINACNTLKAEGKLKHMGISSHGPRGDEPDAMDKVLLRAAEHGGYDVMLLSYGFMNKEEGERVLKVCKEKNIGTTIMKSATGLIEMPVLDLENPSDQVQGWLDYLMGSGMTREAAGERIKNYFERNKEEFETALAASKPFMEKYGVKTQDELNFKSLQWVLRNPDAHTICPSMSSFDDLDKYLPLTGTELSDSGQRFLDEYARAFGTTACRFSCTECISSCPNNLPVNTILRYAYYYNNQNRQKHAMQKYARLGNINASACLHCDAPCVGACPHGVQVQAQMFNAHGRLVMA
jgi:predicted aldo/keto reductase-like oxidoreductase